MKVDFILMKSYRFY